MTLWQCQIITRKGSRTEIIDGSEIITKYVDHDLLMNGEVCIIIQRQVGETPLPRTKESQEILQMKPWWKFW